MRVLSAILVAAGLAACAPTVPDSAQGVGFDDYDTYLAEKQSRDAQLRAGRQDKPQTPEQETARAAVAAVRGTGSQATPARGEGVPSGIRDTSPNAAPVPDLNNPSISDEQDFQAVSGRESIESDAQRRAAQSAQYEVIAPTAVPNRPRGTTPTPIEFALATSHPVGQKTYNRSPFGAGKSAQACASMRSDELAQEAFLDAGGPQKDKLGLDPDGDGYACAWNPQVYRGIVKG